MRKSISFILFLLFFVFYSPLYALTPEEILLLKRSGVSDEKILEMQKKEGATSPQYASPPPINAFDWNEDGLKDIITGSHRGQVYVYLNKGTNKEPIFDKAAKIDGAEVMRFGDPYVVDWNSDGKKDIIAGSRSGEITVFINGMDNKQPIFSGELKLNEGELDVGFFSSPAMVDWNGDGRKDLVVGEKEGGIYLFLNTGTNNMPSFSSKGMKLPIKVKDYATPFIADWNSDGKFDVICGSIDGKVYVFINEGDSKNPKFGNAQTVHVNNKELKLPTPTSVIAVDWDDDGKMDILVSNKEVVEEGSIPDRKNIIPLGIYLLFNTGTKEKPEFKELKQIKGKFKDDSVL